MRVTMVSNVMRVTRVTGGEDEGGRNLVQFRLEGGECLIPLLKLRHLLAFSPIQQLHRLSHRDNVRSCPPIGVVYTVVSDDRFGVSDGRECLG